MTRFNEEEKLLELLDRNYQKKILQEAAAAFPQQLFVFGELAGKSGLAIEDNCLHLCRQGLIEINWIGTEKSGRIVSSVLATELGLAHQAAESAVMAEGDTLRIDANAIRQIFVNGIATAIGDSISRARVAARIQLLTPNCLAELVKESVAAGLRTSPDILGSPDTLEPSPKNLNA